MAYKFRKRDGIVIGTLCAVALGIVLISNQPNVKNLHESHSTLSQSAPVTKKVKHKNSDKSESSATTKSSDHSLNGKVSEDASSDKDTNLNANSGHSGHSDKASESSGHSDKASESSNTKVKHVDSAYVQMGTNEAPTGTSDQSYTPVTDDNKGVYDTDTIDSQSKKVDDNPSYIDKSGSKIKPLVVGDWNFVKGNGDGLYAINKNKEETNYYELSDSVDWALFNGQVNLSDGDYDKVVRFFNTTKAYMKAHNIKINGFGG